MALLFVHFLQAVVFSAVTLDARFWFSYPLHNVAYPLCNAPGSTVLCLLQVHGISAAILGAYKLFLPLNGTGNMG